MRATIPHLEDFQLVQLVVDGDQNALLRLRPLFQSPLVKFLMYKGATDQEAEDISREMWADLLVSNGEGLPKLARFDGNCRLSSWLNTVALNRLLSAKRKQARLDRIGIESLNAAVGNEEGSSTLESMIAAEVAIETETPLIDLLKEAIEVGFAACSPEQFVLIRLAYADRLRYADLARMWSCNPGTISRRLDEARQVVARAVIQHVRKVDPWIELEWEDFAQLCRSASLGALGFD